jgi:hypothetical protein
MRLRTPNPEVSGQYILAPDNWLSGNVPVYVFATLTPDCVIELEHFIETSLADLVFQILLARGIPQE